MIIVAHLGNTGKLVEWKEKSDVPWLHIAIYLKYNISCENQKVAIPVIADVSYPCQCWKTAFHS